MGVVVAFEETRDPAEGLRPLMDMVADDMAAVNRIILDKAVSDVELIPELAHHLINSGGKRLRPMLTIAAAKLCGYEGTGHIRLSAAVEFMHTATLLHDDVVDDSDYRRGKKSARLVWGNQASVLVGDFLLGQAFRMMVDVGSLPALKILSNAAAVIAEGEVMQLAAAKNTATTEDDYLEIIAAKTAALFSAATEVGAAIAQRPATEQTALKSYGRNLGSRSSWWTTPSTIRVTARASVRLSVTISARARSRSLSFCVFAGATRRSGSSGSGRWARARSRTAIWNTPSS